MIRERNRLVIFAHIFKKRKREGRRLRDTEGKRVLINVKPAGMKLAA
ncbi:MAG: hypothetical protein LBG27_13015 [Spirochaetaceae bacterium]|jgi:hypothetical protein|nr:hypothetical protein [Spirochaetaceae bacterium]